MSLKDAIFSSLFMSFNGPENISLMCLSNFSFVVGRFELSQLITGGVIPDRVIFRLIVTQCTVIDLYFISIFVLLTPCFIICFASRNKD